MDARSDLGPRLRAAVTRTDRLLGREVVGSGLTRTQFSVLGAVARRGPLALSELVEREGVNPTMLSRIVGRLEAGGLLHREPHPDDRRAVVVQASTEGVALHDRLQRERTALIDDYLDGLSPQSVQLLAAALPVLEGLAEHLASTAPVRAAAIRPLDAAGAR